MDLQTILHIIFWVPEIVIITAFVIAITLIYTMK